MNIHWDNIYTRIASALTAEGRITTKRLHNTIALSSSEEVSSVDLLEAHDDHLPAWQLRFESLRETMSVHLCLEINHDVILGTEDKESGVVNLVKDNNTILGVSRRHLRLSPTETSLFIVDLNSTNGTRKNGRSIQPNIPYPLHHGDILELGDLTLVVKIEKTPFESDIHTDDTHNTTDMLAQISTAITSNL